MKVAEVDTRGVQRESVGDEEAPLTGGPRRGYDRSDGSSSRTQPPPPSGPPNWFWAGVLVLVLGFVLVLSTGGSDSDAEADSEQLAQISAELDAISAQQAQLAATGASPAPPPAATAGELAVIRGQLNQIAADQERLLAAAAAAEPTAATATVTMPAGHDRLCAFGAGQASSQLRLPAAVVPKHYHWTLEPGTGYDDVNVRSFAGSVEMTVGLAAGETPSSCIPMHSHPDTIAISVVEVLKPDGSVQCLCDEAALPTTTRSCLAQTCAYVAVRPGGPSSDQIVLNLGSTSTLVTSTADTTVRIGYRGTYGGGSGLYITAPSPQSKPIIAMQGESYGARRAFPCLDEPALEATFDMTYILPRVPGLVALANMPTASVAPHPDQPEMDVHRFQRTPVMPTYLICVVVGNLVGIPSPAPGLTSTVVTVWAVPEHVDLLSNAIAVSGQAVYFMEQFTGVDFALPKMDLVAVPGKGGAMENWGLLTMDSESFLVNATIESTHELVKSSNIICHEIAHQWFGDLVTMEWWDNIWLNEGFATLFSFLFVDYVRRGDQTILPHVAGVWESSKGDARSLFHIHINQQHEGIGSSSGPHQNALRSQAHSGASLSHSVGFNTVAYAKAGATLAMAMDTMERLRPGSFSQGLEAYLRMDAFGNSVPMDLWSNLGTALGDPLFAERMLTWSASGGFARVTATVTASLLFFRQCPSEDPRSTILWSIPLVIGGQTAGAPDAATPVVIWLETNELRVPLSQLPGTRPVVKAAGMGLYRVDYTDQWPETVNQVRAVDEGDDVRAAADMIQDAFGLLQDQRLSDPAVPMDLIRASAAHAHAHGGYPLYATWLRELELLGVLMQEESASCYADFENFNMYLMMDLTTRRGDTVGVKQKREDSDSDKIIRPLLLDFQMRTGCPVARQLLCPRVRQAIGHPWEVDNEMRPTLLMTAMRGDCEEWGVTAEEAFTAITDHYHGTTDPSLRHHLLYSLPTAKDATLLMRGLDFGFENLPAMCSTPSTNPIQIMCSSDWQRLFSATVLNPAGGARAAWQWLKPKLQDPNVYSQRILSILCAGISSQDVLDDMQRTFGISTPEINAEDHPALFSVQQNIARRAYQSSALCDWLASDRATRESQAPPPGPPPPPLQKMIVYNAKAIHTVTEPDGSGGAVSFVVIGDRFAEVCSTDEGRCSLSSLRALYPGATELDAAGKTITPGLIDAHGHLIGVGEAMLEVTLRGADSKAECLRRIQAFVQDNPDTVQGGGWILGTRWDQTLWDGPDTPFPTKYDLDTAFPTTPIWLSRVDGHGGWANSAAIRAAEAFNGAPLPSVDPFGGQIIRLSNGEPSGVFLDAAMGLIRDAIPPFSHDVKLRALRQGVQELNKWGLTSIQDAGVPPEDIELYMESVDRGEFSLRNYIMVESNACSTADERVEHFCASTYTPFWGDYGAHRLRIHSVKIHLDGALGSYGAVMLEPYSHLPDGYTGDPRGTFRLSPEIFTAAVEHWQAAGFQVNTHCIGDACDRLCIDAYERALNLIGSDGSAERHRIEHAQILSEPDLPRLAPLHIIASMQPTHATSDSSWAESRIGSERIAGAYAWRRLLDSGARLALGSDFTVERPNPMLGIYAAVTRQRVVTCDGTWSGVCPTGQPEGGWYPDQKLTRFEALRGFTVDAAYAAFDESQLGRIAPGGLADFLLLDRDIMDPYTCPDDDILDARAEQVYLGGERVL